MKDDGMISRLPTYKQAVEKRSPILKNADEIGNLVFGELEDGRPKREEAK